LTPDGVAGSRTLRRRRIAAAAGPPDFEPPQGAVDEARDSVRRDHDGLVWTAPARGRINRARRTERARVARRRR
jgi:hypothetical protein